MGRGSEGSRGPLPCYDRPLHPAPEAGCCTRVHAAETRPEALAAGDCHGVRRLVMRINSTSGKQRGHVPARLRQEELVRKRAGGEGKRVDAQPCGQGPARVTVVPGHASLEAADGQHPRHVGGAPPSPAVPLCRQQ